MPRIFKGSGSTLRLLIHKCVNYNALGNLKVVLYTTNPEIAVQVTEGIVVEGNRVVFTLPSTAFASMDDGVINYIIEGIIDNDFFSTERQSDYYLKTPTSYIAEGGSYQEKYLNVNENGLYEVIPDEGKDAMTKVSVNVDIQPNLGHLYADFEDMDGEGNYWRYGFDDGLDGFNYVKINASAYGEQKRSEGYDHGHSDGRNDGIELGKSYARDEAEELYITENGVFEGPLYKKVEVNIVPRFFIKDSGMKLGYSSFTQIPDSIDFTDCTDFNYMFGTCNSLTDLNHPTLANVAPTNLSNVFYFCSNLVDLTPVSGWDTSNTKEMNYAFAGCSKLEDLTPIGNWDTSKVKDMTSFIYSCGKLHTIPALRADSLQSGRISVGYSSVPSVVNFGGLINLKTSQTSYFLEYLPNLNYESCINVLNGLYDFTANGETPTSEQGTLKVHQNFLDLVGDEISIAINKNWRITA